MAAPSAAVRSSAVSRGPRRPDFGPGQTRRGSARSLRRVRSPAGPGSLPAPDSNTESARTRSQQEHGVSKNTESARTRSQQEHGVSKNTESARTRSQQEHGVSKNTESARIAGYQSWDAGVLLPPRGAGSFKWPLHRLLSATQLSAEARGARTSVQGRPEEARKIPAKGALSGWSGFPFGARQ